MQYSSLQQKMPIWYKVVVVFKSEAYRYMYIYVYIHTLYTQDRYN